MSRALKSNWQPSATLEHLTLRARILSQIREFFSARGVLEVDTPLMCHTSVTDTHIESIPAIFQGHSSTAQQTYYLQTSPEYAMKRLLAAGSGAIFQICKAFRQGEVGRLHNPEFTMLEWYRPDYDHHALMNEMDELLQLVLHVPAAERKSYAQIFQDYLQIDPHTASLDELSDCAQQQKLDVQANITDRDTWLQLLLSECIEPHIGKERPIFIYDFPMSQAALARIQPGNPPTASRFEVYMHGIELANGFHELQNVAEQRARFENNCAERLKSNLPAIAIDEHFLAALEHGLPDCAGVALGLDRLVMIAAKCQSIADVLSFNFSKA
jgi:elongation factor P--(R)-beta-lysine ligase